MNLKVYKYVTVLFIIISFFSVFPVYADSDAHDLDQIISKGEIIHLGIPYANFIKGNGEGLDVELIQGFAEYLGVKYRFVRTSWDKAFTDLTGKTYEINKNTVKVTGDAEIKGDILSTGLTKLGWREKIVNFSSNIFPTQVWCIARSDSEIIPIQSSGDILKDIAAVKKQLLKRKILCKRGTCLTPELYGIDTSMAQINNFDGNLNDLAPAVIKGEAEVSLLDVPDALIALEKWPGKLKIIGPLSKKQVMASAFRKDSPELRAKFNEYLSEIMNNGKYHELVKKYYPAVYTYFSSFFDRNSK
ncbi:transporter substrate-binding domain-containing protein [Maridesulfovibrio bastinii]|uniref:transporter substrate-binding domain-containing protein n=1 Tax=Maridesulfovibrio bastinii TaxID=47157 RepID=UPI000416825E|nr:transporter substrate-binding domain-containing protein [Maridesulfovibrio bastinii]